jgi:hypothetical protein
MRVSTQKIVQHQWLPLLMVLVLAAGIVMSPVSWMENQQQGIGLEAETESVSSGDDKLMAGLLPDPMVNKSLSVSPVIPETLSSTGSDAYSSLTLHGPPVPNYPV